VKENMEQGRRRAARRELAVAVLLILCAAVVGFWEVMSNRSQRPFQPFELMAADFADFEPRSENWTFESIPLSPDPIEPNILAYVMTRRVYGTMGAGQRGTVIVRLVHGYNMVDCMRIKGDEVQLLADTRGLETAARRCQSWRIVSPIKDAAVWVTSMIRVGDFGETNIDTRDMAFPRVGIPDNPGWFPRGLSLESLKHPIRNGRLFLRAKWNASRTDVLTFLRLKQPAWASEDLLTVVAASAAKPSGSVDEAEVTAHVLAAHGMFYEQLRAWRLRKLAQTDDSQ